MDHSDASPAGSLVDLLPVGVCLVDESWRIEQWNRLLEAWTGRPRGEVVGVELFAAFPPLAEPRYRGRLRAVLDGGPPALFSPQLNASFFPCLLPDGNARRQRVTVTLAREGELRRVLIAVEDATESLKQIGMISSLRMDALREVEERRRIEREREKLIGELQHALGSIKVLSGLIPICASCKKVRNDKGYWGSVEAYVREHTGADFTHGLCPDCLRKALAEEAE